MSIKMNIANFSLGKSGLQLLRETQDSVLAKNTRIYTEKIKSDFSGSRFPPLKISRKDEFTVHKLKNLQVEC